MGKRVKGGQYTMSNTEARATSQAVVMHNLSCDQDKCRWKAGPFKSEATAAIMWKEHMKSHGIEVK